MRSVLTIFVVAVLVCGFGAAANAAPFLGYDKAPGDPNPSYPPQYYKAPTSSGAGWMHMTGGSEFKTSQPGYDKAPGDPNPSYPPGYYKAADTKGNGWMNMTGSK